MGCGVWRRDLASFFFSSANHIECITQVSSEALRGKVIRLWSGNLRPSLVVEWALSADLLLGYPMMGRGGFRIFAPPNAAKYQIPERDVPKICQETYRMQSRLLTFNEKVLLLHPV